MSWNNIKYDACNYQKELDEQMNEFKYVMDNSKYVNCNKCRMVKGITGGNDVSQISGNLVDLDLNYRLKFLLVTGLATLIQLGKLIM